MRVRGGRVFSDTPTYRIEYPTLVYDDRTPSQSFSAREVVGVRGSGTECRGVTVPWWFSARRSCCIKHECRKDRKIDYTIILHTALSLCIATHPDAPNTNTNARTSIRPRASPDFGKSWRNTNRDIERTRPVPLSSYIRYTTASWSPSSLHCTAL